MKITSRKAALGGFASLGVVTLLAGCGSAPTDDSTKSAASDFLPCMVSDAGGFDDRSFNQLSFEGMKAAAKELGVETKEAESSVETDFPSNLTSLVDADCDLITSVGYNLSAATVESATANPEVHYAIVDDLADNNFDGTTDADNIKPIIFDTVGAAFLAGYAAADTTKTGIVGTFGGMSIPSVTIFMDGFQQGVNYYNTEKGAEVKVLGWDYTTQEGSFTGGFEANEKAKSLAQGLLDQDVDVIMPVGGPIYQSAAEAIIDSKKDIALIGVDADLFVSDPTYKDMYLTSVLKGLSKGVEETVLSAEKGNFSTDPYVGTLENDGVGIAPFHNWEDKVSKTLQAELDDVKAGLIDGSITATSVSSPKQ
ncbi:BMP family lipoprotein [Klugiella xanthotipulae]|uniref:BMP family lipoprotein n=1 Tax=Klugiella xanthotipulae TaxID=244735 RepID=UPI001153CE28|nr:BMP family ABC transporter substrate-binding protein [Klugiella xanthotipulae]